MAEVTAGTRPGAPKQDELKTEAELIAEAVDLAREPLLPGLPPPDSAEATADGAPDEPLDGQQQRLLQLVERLGIEALTPDEISSTPFALTASGEQWWSLVDILNGVLDQLHARVMP